LVFSGGLTLRRFGQQLSQGLDNIVVGRWLGAEALGLYGRAYQLISFPPATIGKAMGAVMFPVLSRVQNDRPRLAVAYRRSTAVLALVTIPAAVAVTLAPELIMDPARPDWLGVTRRCRSGARHFLPSDLSAVGSARHGRRNSSMPSPGARARRPRRCAGRCADRPALGAARVAGGVLAAQILTYALVTQLCLRLTSLSFAWAVAHVRGLVLGALTGMGLWLLVAACAASKPRPRSFWAGVVSPRWSRSPASGCV
jgi:PST family polysaccharide transporter